MADLDCGNGIGEDSDGVEGKIHVDDVAMILWAKQKLATIASRCQNSWTITNGLGMERSDNRVVLPEGPDADAATKA